MNEQDIDERLRAEAQHWIDANSSTPPLDRHLRAVTQGPTRSVRFRVWAAPLAVAATVAGIAVGTVAVLNRHDRSSSTGPNVTAAHALLVSPGATPSTGGRQNPPAFIPRAASDVAACDPANFEKAPTVASGRTAGGVLLQVSLTYRGEQECRIGAKGAAATLLKKDGAALASGYDTLDDLVPDVLIRPGTVVTTGAIWKFHCGTASPTSLRLILDGLGGPGFVYDLGQPVEPSCPSASQGGAFEIIGLRPRVAGRGSAEGLVANLSTDASVDAGASLPVSISLVNATNNSISLADCPSFVLQLNEVGAMTAPNDPAASYTVNCADAPKQVTPGSTVKLAVIFDTQGAGKGPHLLSWHWTGVPLVFEGQNAVAVEVR
jgi:hypothetical protein